MRFVLQREASTKDSTPGRLYLQTSAGPVELCYTLEDVVRHGVKVPGRTAIPAGEYAVTITESVRFKRKLPLLASVPNFTGVRIHGGNTHENTEGCILVARDRVSPDRIRNCAPALSQIMTLIQAAAARREPVTIRIEAATP